MKNWFVLFVHVPNWYTFMQAHMLATSLARYFSYFLLLVSWLHPFRNCTW